MQDPGMEGTSQPFLLCLDYLSQVPQPDPYPHLPQELQTPFPIMLTLVRGQGILR